MFWDSRLCELFGQPFTPESCGFLETVKNAFQLWQFKGHIYMMYFRQR